MRNPRGVTFIELLTVVVIIGLLTVFAIPRLTRNKEKAILASMQSDLRHLANAEEGFYYSNATCSVDQVALNLTLTTGNVLVINEATAAGWSATISHAPIVPGELLPVSRKCYAGGFSDDRGVGRLQLISPWAGCPATSSTLPPGA